MGPSRRRWPLRYSADQLRRVSAARRGSPLIRSACCRRRRISAALENWWLALRTPGDAASLPFTGGWLLYLGYELAAEIEPRLRLPPSADPVVALAIRAPAAWIRDRQSGEAGSSRSRATSTCSSASRRMCAARRRRRDAEPPRIEVREEDPARFLHAVARALEYIAAGDVYQANLSRRWQGRSGAAASIRRRCTDGCAPPIPSPFAALMRDGDFAVISSSPERLLCVRAGTVSTRPIAGTRPRGASPDRDAALIDTLLGNEKERAEHVMLIDLERNDLGRICAGGSVRVDEYMAVESYAHVHHIVSNVSGLLREGVTPIQSHPRAVSRRHHHGLPEGALHGDHRRARGRPGAEPIPGAIGYLNRDGSCDLQHPDPHDHRARRDAVRFAPAPASSPTRIRPRNWPRRAPRPKGCCAHWGCPT